MENTTTEKKNSQLTETEKQAKMYRLVTEIEELTTKKKASAAGYRDSIKELKKEMIDILIKDGKDVD